MLDGLAFEPQFLDHVAPVWRALPDSVRGTLRVGTTLADRAARLGLDVELVDADAMRQSSPPPRAKPGPGPRAFTVSIGDIKIGRRLGYQNFAFMEHGAGQAYFGDQHGARHPSYAGGDDREDVGLFLVPNQYSADLWRRYPAQIEIVGCPKLDVLPAKEPGPLTVAISFHWPGFVAPEADTALGAFLPALKPLSGAFHTIGHAHPKGDWPLRMERLYRRAGIEFVPDFDEVCRRADVYICDNSSTIFEFAATGRPVVVLNSPIYRRNIDHGLRFWEAATVGPQVDKPDELVPAVERALKGCPEDLKAREAALNVVYAYRTGAAERAAGVLARWMDAGQAQGFADDDQPGGG